MSFFSKKEMQSKSRPDGRVYSCASCKLYKDVKSPKIELYGKGKRKILIIGEAPGEMEDRRGLPWQGKTGRLLERTLADLGIDLFSDCASINAVNCRPPDNRSPGGYEIDCCRTVMLAKAIKKYKPKVTLLLGTAALQSFIGPRWGGDLSGITKWRGFTIPDHDYNCWTLPTFHPSFVERSDREITTIWKQDLELLPELANKPLPKKPNPDIQYIDDLSIFNHIKAGSRIAFDYETTGIKPHANGHRIICASVAVDREKVYAFMMPKTRKERKPFIDLLKNPAIGKMAHNVKFEYAWSFNRLYTEVQNWEWDSMLMAHMLDNRPGVTGLKFQTFVRFGISNYSSDIAPWLRAKTNNKSGNAINQVQDLLYKPGGQKKLLKYCALDSHYQYLLATMQMELVNYDPLPF